MPGDPTIDGLSASAQEWNGDRGRYQRRHSERETNPTMARGVRSMQRRLSKTTFRVIFDVHERGRHASFIHHGRSSRLVERSVT